MAVLFADPSRVIPLGELGYVDIGGVSIQVGPDLWLTLAASGSSPATISLVTVDGTGTVQTPTILAGATVAVTTVDGAGSVPTPTIVGDVVITTVTVDGTGSVSTPTITASATITTVAVDGAGSVPSPTIVGDVVITTVTVDGAGSVPTPGLTASTVITVSTVAASANVETAEVITGIIASLATVEATGSVGSVVIVGDTTISVVTVDGTGTVPTPTIITASTTTTEGYALLFVFCNTMRLRAAGGGRVHTEVKPQGDVAFPLKISIVNDGEVIDGGDFSNARITCLRNQVAPTEWATPKTTGITVGDGAEYTYKVEFTSSDRGALLPGRYVLRLEADPGLILEWGHEVK